MCEESNMRRRPPLPSPSLAQDPETTGIRSNIFSAGLAKHHQMTKYLSLALPPILGRFELLVVRLRWEPHCLEGGKLKCCSS